MNLPALLILCLCLLAMMVYWKVQGCDFLVWDDFEYVVENPHVRYGLSAENVRWALTAFYASNWHPLTWLSHMLDCQLYGLNPAGHHLNNLLLHVINTIFLFLLFERMTRSIWRSAFVAAIFALHPLHVESVAWISERKDLLGSLFWILACLAYQSYVSKPRIRIYILCLCLYALGLASKPMTVSLPLVMLLLDYWPCARPLSLDGRSISGMRPLMVLIKEKWPFFALAACSSLLTFFASKSEQAVASMGALPLGIRLENASVSYAAYLIKAFWPHDLAFFYPHPLGTISVWKVAASTLLLLSISFLAIKTRRKYAFLLVGWFWYLITLLPVIGLIQVGSQAMADRYTYVPLIGISVMVAWGTAAVFKEWAYRRYAFASACGIVLLLLTFRSSAEIRHWRNGEALFERALEVTTGNYTAHYQLGNELMRQGKLDSAIHHFSEAVRIRPDHFIAHHNLGIALARQGRFDEALAHYVTALRIRPENPGILSSMGDLYLMQGKLDQAIFSYSEALRADSSLWKVHNNLGTAFLRKRMGAEAARHFEEALRIHPGDQKVERNLHLARQESGGAKPKE